MFADGVHSPPHQLQFVRRFTGTISRFFRQRQRNRCWIAENPTETFAAYESSPKNLANVASLGGLVSSDVTTNAMTEQVKIATTGMISK